MIDLQQLLDAANLSAGDKAFAAQMAPRLFEYSTKEFTQLGWSKGLLRPIVLPCAFELALFAAKRGADKAILESPSGDTSARHFYLAATSEQRGRMYQQFGLRTQEEDALSQIAFGINAITINSAAPQLSAGSLTPAAVTSTIEIALKMIRDWQKPPESSN